MALILDKRATIETSNCDQFVIDTYKRPSCFQQQDGCQARGNVHFCVPEKIDEEYLDTIPEVVNGPTMGVSFASWLARRPKKSIPKDNDYLHLWWERNFYPDLQMVANDLHHKGLLPAGDYVINIDW